MPLSPICDCNFASKDLICDAASPDFSASTPDFHIVPHHANPDFTLAFICSPNFQNQSLILATAALTNSLKLPHDFFIAAQPELIALPNH